MSSNLIVTKKDAEGALRNALRNYVLGLVFISHSDELNWSVIGSATLTTNAPPLRVDCPLYPLLGEISSLKRDRPSVVREFCGMLRRASIGESHELMTEYCYKTGQQAKYKGVSWFQFARIARNTVSHRQGGILRWPDDLKKSQIREVSWRHRVIRDSDEGHEFQMPDAEVLQLIGDMLEFLERGLD